jgi:glutamate synthase domain-containing protein 3
MKDIEKLIESYIESAIYINDNYMDRIVKTHNSHVENMNKITSYLEKMKALERLHALLNHPVDYVRFTTAHRLLPFYEEEAKKVYHEIIEKKIPLMSSTARISLQQWEEKKTMETKE